MGTTGATLFGYAWLRLVTLFGRNVNNILVTSKLIKTLSHIVTIDRSTLSMLIIWGTCFKPVKHLGPSAFSRRTLVLRTRVYYVIKHWASVFNYYLKCAIRRNVKFLFSRLNAKRGRGSFSVQSG